jgi:hypothetical protein
MTASLDTYADALIDAARAIEDPSARYEAVKAVEARLGHGWKQVKAEAAKELYEGRTWEQVGDILHVTGSRAEQISRAAR